MKKNKGFSNILIISFFLIFLVIATFAYFFFQNKTIISKENKPQTEVAKQTESKNDNPTPESNPTTEPECATPDMFSKEPAKILEPLTANELKDMNQYVNDFDYLNIISFKGNKDDRYLVVPGGPYEKDKTVIANKLGPGDPGQYQTSSYVFSKSNCILPVAQHQLPLGERIKKINIKGSDITIYEAPGCCTAYTPYVLYYIELSPEYQKIANAKFIQIYPMYEGNLERVLRSIKFIPIEMKE